MKALLAVGWSWYPSVLIGFGAWTLMYVLAIRKGKKTPILAQAAFHLGTLAGLLALVSPLDALGDEYLFSAHMVQHLLLMFAAPPLWLLGAPGWLVDRAVYRRLAGPVAWLTGPVPAYLIFTTVLGVWHIPAFYKLALQSEALHIFEHLTFIGAALIAWWPVAVSATSRFKKPEPPVRMLYLFLLTIPCTALAAMLTFAKMPFYSFYVSAPHIFGLDALQDQQLGGLLMWLPTHLVLLSALGGTFLMWFRDSNENQLGISSSLTPQGTEG